MLNWIVRELFDHLNVYKQTKKNKTESFDCVQKNEYCWMELLVLNSNTWNSSTVYLNWIIGIA